MIRNLRTGEEYRKAKGDTLGPVESPLTLVDVQPNVKVVLSRVGILYELPYREWTMNFVALRIISEDGEHKALLKNKVTGKQFSVAKGDVVEGLNVIFISQQEVKLSREGRSFSLSPRERVAGPQKFILKGIIRVQGEDPSQWELTAGIYDPSRPEIHWRGIGEEIGSYKVKSIDPQNRIVTLYDEESERSLELKMG